jgi:hypothetical protein
LKPGAGGCNPNLNYSGGRDQEDHGLRPAQANSSRDLISKTPQKNPKNHHTHTQKASRVAQDVDPESTTWQEHPIEDSSPVPLNGTGSIPSFEKKKICLDN